MELERIVNMVRELDDLYLAELPLETVEIRIWEFKVCLEHIAIVGKNR